MQIKTEDIAVADHNWKQYTLINDHNFEVSCLNLGGIITRIMAPDRNNKFENVVLGFKDYADYAKNPTFFGALIGRVAGRIDGASFELDGNTYTLPANDGENHLHGGDPGFHNVIWDVTPFEEPNQVGIVLTYTTPDGENGYPGTVDMKVTYTLDNNNAFTITYEGTSDQTTALTATNHSYFNLSGDLKADIRDHEVMIDASQFVELDAHLIPTGNKVDVDDTVFDFRNGRLVKDGTTSDYKQNEVATGGYDHFFLFDNNKRDDVVVKEKESGRKLTVKTDQPGMVMFTSNTMDDKLQLLEGPSRRYLGLCLETQSSPASLHHEGFPSVVLEKGDTYKAKTTFEFGLI
ncbi:galactose mutarotase [Aquibacillus koreensis]|uniref:Aldose 1-epimerase n=1 Tax=Aquibacillus koreensis TaxID=279446 RepID=A0A9X4AID7_9BACI|nr:aldose epimerase family protein [Aquibacillus koreensis]MCT2538175.1 galactose mutarotase [Aquibacillus koreensis]MDC3420881.1 galactose mutarotase [Aquibacillus koreensis]